MQQIDWVFNFFYTTGYPLSRISLCLLYRRIFVQHWFRLISLFFVGVFACYSISTIIVDSVLTLPVNSFWDSDVKATHTLDLVKLYTANAAFNITTDTILLFLPLTIVWRLSMTWMQKLGLTAIFGLGALTLVASIARMTTFGAVRGDDITCVYLPLPLALCTVSLYPHLQGEMPLTARLPQTQSHPSPGGRTLSSCSVSSAPVLSPSGPSSALLRTSYLHASAPETRGIPSPTT